MNNRFIDGNVIVLYALFKSSSTQEELPDFILRRVRMCLDVYRIIMRSKPDKNRTAIYIVTNSESNLNVKNELLKAGIGEDSIMVDTNSKNLRQTCDGINRFIRDKINPPKIYFVGSAWQRESFDSIVPIRLKGYVVQFEGALDSRSVVEIDSENAMDAPKRGIQFYKKQAKEKAANLLLNILFQNDRKAGR